MIRDLYLPSDFDTVDFDPTIPAEQKLEIITNTPITVKGDDEYTSLHLPFGIWAGFFTVPKPNFSGEAHMIMDHMSVNDPALYRHGIGSRLLRASVRYGLEVEPDLTWFTTNWARWGFVNTAVKVFGVDNVYASNAGVNYGWNGTKPLEALLDDMPPRDGKTYMVNGISARIDSQIARTWELPKEMTAVQL